MKLVEPDKITVKQLVNKVRKKLLVDLTISGIFSSFLNNLFEKKLNICRRFHTFAELVKALRCKDCKYLKFSDWN